MLCYRVRLAYGVTNNIHDDLNDDLNRTRIISMMAIRLFLRKHNLENICIFTISDSIISAFTSQLACFYLDERVLRKDLPEGLSV